MSTENTRKQRIEEIFLTARDLSGTDLDSYLNKACSDDLGIRDAVENLLGADKQPDSLLDGTLDLLSADRRGAADYEGKVIGRYRILQRIGEGGFGVVYMAEQTEPLRRKVALKLIKPGMDSREVVARFEAERQALAMMDHPNISKVLDAGTTDAGRPYFVMELVKGIPITEYCDHNSLTTSQRLELFNSVCLAVQHAHQKGVIHRDLKPTNVMVTLHDGKPVPKVIDFGVAKALSQHLTEKTLFTRYGQVVGTPQYMSPEQAEMSGLDVDTRSDIYSLGVLLYELLTGNTPLDASQLRTAGYDAMRRMICEIDLPKPSTRLRTLDAETATGVASLRSTAPQALTKRMAGDLDWIVMKCLDKDRNRRYDTATGLANDIKRYLLEEPIEAGPPTFKYQLSKLYRRNRTAAAAAAAVAVSLIVGISLTTIAWANETAQRKVAEEQTQIAEKQRQLAQAAQAVAEENAEKEREQTAIAKREATRAKSTLDVIKSLLTQASPDPEKGTEVMVSEFLSSFAADLDSVNLEDPEVEIEIRLTLADALARFSMSDEEQQQYEIAEHIARKTYPPRSEDLARFLLKRSHSIPCLEEALGYLDGISNSTSLEADLRTHLGHRLKWDKPFQARDQWTRACELVRELSDAEKATLEMNPFASLAYYLGRHHDLETAKDVSKEAIEFSRQFGDPRDQVMTLLAVRRIANGGKRELNVNKARDIAVKARDGVALALVLDAAMEDRWGHALADPGFAIQLKNDLVTNWEYIHDKNPSIGDVWGMLIQLGKSKDAAQLETLIKKLPYRLQQRAASGAAQRLRIAGRLRSADTMFDRAFPDDSWNPTYKARCRSAGRDFQAAIPLFEQAIQRCKPDAITTPTWLRCELALSLEAAGETEKARVAFAKLVPDLIQANEQNTHSGALLLLCVARSDRWNDLSSKSIEAIETKLKTKLKESKEPNIVRMLRAAALGLLEEHRGNRKRQIDYFVAANRYRPRTLVAMNGEWISDTVVKLLGETGQTERLEQVLRDDVRNRDESLPRIHPERAFARIRLAELLIKDAGRLQEAKTLLAEAEEVYEYHGDWIPAKEHETLKNFQQKVATSLQTQR